MPNIISVTVTSVQPILFFEAGQVLPGYVYRAYTKSVDPHQMSQHSQDHI